MSQLRIIRLCLWGTALVFATIVLGLAAHQTWLASSNSFTAATSVATSPFTSLALAVAALTLFTLPIFIAIDETRKGAITSMIIVEMVTLTILWILWLSAGSLSASAASAILAGLGGSCSNLGGIDAVACNEHSAITAFCYLSFFAIMGYAFILLVFTMIAHNRGHREIWLQSVKYANFFAPHVDSAPTPGNADKGGGVPQFFAPQAQHLYHPGVVTPPPMITTPPPMYTTPPPMFTTPPPQGMPFGVFGQPMQFMNSPIIPQQNLAFNMHPSTPRV